MALRYGDRVMETTTTTGTGALTLAAAVTGFQRFSAIPSIATSDTVYYAIWAVDSGGTPTGDWETGLGTYSAANELTRTTVQASSNANAAVSFSAGTKRVMASPTAGNITTLVGGTGSAVITLTDAATVTPDCSLGNNFRWTIGGNRTLANPTNPTDGQLINIRIIQDGTGNRTWALGSKYKFAGGAPLLSTVASSRDFVSCQYDATDDTWNCAIAKGMA